jgi:predicted TIM-barrel fold metal-dependent hydrolase
VASPIIDIHPHIISTDTVRYPITPLGGRRSDWSGERSVTLERMISAMDEAGVDKAAMVHSSTTYGFACEYVADAVAAYPQRLTGVFSVNVIEPDAAQKMRYWYSKGLTGMRIFSRGSTMKEPWLALDDPRIGPCFECAEELGISVATNVTVEVFSQLETVLKQFPKVSFILDHLGGTDFTDGAPYNAAASLWKLARYPNLYLKVASRNYSESRKGKATPETLFPKIVAEFGSNRMAWGSNYPASEGTLTELLELARKTVACLPSRDQEQIFGGTALSLYPALKS